MLGVPHLVYVNQAHHYQQSPDLTQGCSSRSNSHLKKQKFYTVAHVEIAFYANNGRHSSRRGAFWNRLDC